MKMYWRNDSAICDYTDYPYCYLSGRRWIRLDRHHIMNGTKQLRKFSEKEGLWVYLDHDVHMALHFTKQGIEWEKTLKQEAQKAYEKNHSRESWMKIVRKNYL